MICSLYNGLQKGGSEAICSPQSHGVPYRPSVSQWQEGAQGGYPVARQAKYSNVQNKQIIGGQL